MLIELDGVLVDTAAAHRSLWGWWAGRIGLDPSLVAATAWGISDRDAVLALCPARDPESELAAIRERRLVLLRTVRKVRGAVSLIRSLPPRRWAIVTSATAEQTSRLLRRARLQPPTVVVSADDHAAGRPGPAAHLAAAVRLGYAPTACAALESSPAGVLAAHAAGAVAIAVAPRSGQAALAGAEAVRGDLGGVQIQLLGDGRLQVRAAREARLLP